VYKRQALIVEDVITTGGSIRELIDLVEDGGAEVVGIGAVIERGESMDFGVDKKVLLELEASAWKAQSCPLCREGVGMEEPGSKRRLEG
jgi:orotate phosphoribosyltransferase